MRRIRKVGTNEFFGGMCDGQPCFVDPSKERKPIINFPDPPAKPEREWNNQETFQQEILYHDYVMLRRLSYSLPPALRWHVEVVDGQGNIVVVNAYAD